jgi:hypothetical protein
MLEHLGNIDAGRLQGQVSILDIEEMVEVGAMGTNLLI